MLVRLQLRSLAPARGYKAKPGSTGFVDCLPLNLICPITAQVPPLVVLVSVLHRVAYTGSASPISKSSESMVVAIVECKGLNSLFNWSVQLLTESSQVPNDAESALEILKKRAASSPADSAVPRHGRSRSASAVSQKSSLGMHRRSVSRWYPLNGYGKLACLSTFVDHSQALSLA